MRDQHNSKFKLFNAFYSLTYFNLFLQLNNFLFHLFFFFHSKFLVYIFFRHDYVFWLLYILSIKARIFNISIDSSSLIIFFIFSTTLVTNTRNKECFLTNTRYFRCYKVFILLHLTQLNFLFPTFLKSLHENNFLITEDSLILFCNYLIFIRRK